MQCADIFFLKADICQLGMDQRKVNMLAREYCDTLKRKNKPVILSHVMLMGLKQGQEKMSKRDPDSAIWMEDSAEEVRTKIRKAFCPPGEAAANPVLQYVRHLTLPWFGTVAIPRTGADGAAAPHAYTDYAALEADYVAGLVHPGDLKAALTDGLNAILQPVRDHFVNDKEAAELLRKVKSYKVTR
jgi:tyrosyl-tRNA synthetase